MSDDDDFMQDSGDEEYDRPPPLHQIFRNMTDQSRDNRYDFEYEDADDDESGDVGIENKYYNAKQMKVDNPEEAIDEFLGVPALEEEKSDWYVLYATVQEY